ncbi:MAG: hypothetical protein N2690_11115, partial [Rhodocyclaceae bacterium]|nr:hypothetical protein [Rhodocyclaceae bacterium]
MDTDRAEALAERLLIRDREADDRRLCIECRNLAGGPGRWRCTGGGSAPGSVPADMVVRLLQRCDGFEEAG